MLRGWQPIKMLQGVGGGSFQRQPAAPKSLWRLLAKSYMRDGWRVFELSFHSDAQCKSDPQFGRRCHKKYMDCYFGLGRELAENMRECGTHCGFASGQHDMNRIVRVFDANSMDTYWQADCAPCEANEAWVAIDLETPADIGCFWIFQDGHTPHRSRNIALESWDGERWRPEREFHEMAGGSWEKRPQLYGTMWRILLEEMHAPCIEGAKPRVWGIQELGFYSDDACENKLIGEPINGGHVHDPSPNRPIDYYGPAKAFDGKLGPGFTWGSNCRVPRGDMKAACVEEEEWIGLRFEDPADVKCIQLEQSMQDGNVCCDMADKLSLQSWNGTSWQRARWPHQPPTTPSQRADTKRPLRRLGAKFRNVAQGCTEDPVKRGRKQSEFCIVPLTKAVTILVDKYCKDHPACVQAGFETGDCCPAEGIISRCCCSHQIDAPVFLDETNQIILEWRFEYFTIQSTGYLVWLFTGGAIVSMVLSRNSVEDQMLFDGDRDFIKALVFIQRTLHASVEKDRILRFFLIPPRQKEMMPVLVFKYVFWCTSAFFIGGSGIWVFVAIFFAFLILGAMRMFSISLRWCVSALDPKDPTDMKIRALWAKYPLRNNAEEGGFQNVPIVKVAEQTGTGLAAGAGYFVKMFLDMLLMRLIVSIMMREVFGKEADRGFYQVMEAQILGRNTTNVNIGSTNTTRRLSPVERVRADRAVLLDEYYFWKHVVSTTVAPFQEPARAVRKALEPVASLVPQAAGFPGLIPGLVTALGSQPDLRRLTDAAPVDESATTEAMAEIKIDMIFAEFPTFAGPLEVARESGRRPSAVAS
jgi:hypothetical protein